MIDVELTGADNVIIRLKQMKDNVDFGTESALSDFATDIRDLAKIFVPVDTGSLQTSIRIQNMRSVSGQHAIGVTAGGYVTNPKTGRIVDYAKFVERGTSRMRAQPYMRPALEMCRSGLVKLIVEAIRK